MIIQSEPLALYTFEVDGRDAFRDWYKAVSETSAGNLVKSRIRRICKGSVGDAKAFRFTNKAENPMLIEFRFNIKSGFRIYAARCRNGLVLLNAGTKRRQREDVKLATALCRRYASKEGAVRRFARSGAES